MKRPLYLARLVAAVLLLGAAAVHAETFVYQDWAVACDNTRGCEAIGFQSEAGGSNPVELWLSRDPGPRTPVLGRVTALVRAPGGDGKFRISVGTGVTVTQGADKNLDDAAMRRLLPALLDAASADVQAGSEHFTLSLAGLKAALLKMDDLQGRVGTPGALVRKGKQAESAVPGPLTPRRVQPAVMFQNKSTDAQLLKILLPALGSGCDIPVTASVDSANVAIHRASESRVIVLRECARGPLQSNYAAFLVDDKPPYASHRITFPLIAGGSADTIVNAQLQEFQAGLEMRSLVQKHASGDDCGSDAWWTWTAQQQFELDNGHDSPLCRGLPEGGFALRTYIAPR